MTLTVNKKTYEAGELVAYVEKLTKAKEIIREYMNWADWKGSNCPSFAKAEQFLKEK